MLETANWLVPDVDRVLLFISIALCGMLGFYAFSKKVLDARASVLASLIGIVIILYSDLFWFFLLLFFLIVTYFVTIWKYSYKRKRGISEGKGGERGIKNVLANGIIPVLIAFLSEPLDSVSDGMAGFMFIAAIAIATADTFGSEIGILADGPKLITSPGRTVEPGMDGGVSLLGNIAALVGALLISIIGILFVSDMIIPWEPHTLSAGWIPLLFLTAIGWLGCQLDSLLGATLQQKGLLTNNTVNFVTITIGSVCSFMIYFLVVLVN
jgi:uncharacterized protein (TIGR00297 family)